MLDRKRISILQVFHVILSSRSNSLTCCEDLGTCSGNHCKCASECVQLDMKAIQCIQHRGHLYYLCFGIFSEALHRRYKREPQTNQKLSTAARSALEKNQPGAQRETVGEFFCSSWRAVTETCASRGRTSPRHHTRCSQRSNQLFCSVL